MNKTNVLFPSRMHSRCREEIVRMSLCSSCRNLHAKPCSGYCLNVMRGCLRHFSSALDLPWSGFMDALEQLLQRQVAMGSNPATIQLLASLEESVRSLDVKASEAIMKAMMEGIELEKRVSAASKLVSTGRFVILIRGRHKTGMRLDVYHRGSHSGCICMVV